MDESEIKSLQKVIDSRDSELRKIEKFADRLKVLSLDNYKKELAGLEGDPPALVAVKIGASSLVQNVKGSMQRPRCSKSAMMSLCIRPCRLHSS